MRTADHMGLLFRSRLVAFGSKGAMTSSEDPIVRQFLAGQAEGPIGMDEMAEAGTSPRAPRVPSLLRASVAAGAGGDPLSRALGAWRRITVQGPPVGSPRRSECGGSEGRWQRL